MNPTTITTAARQYAQRPPDERFPSLDAMLADAVHDKNLSAERTYNLKDLVVRAANVDDPNADNLPPDRSTLHLVSPKGPALMTHWAFGQLCRTLGAPAGYLRTLPPAIAADALNFGLQDSVPGTAGNILARMANGSPLPIVRSCTSETYGRLWDSDLYGAVARTVVARSGQWSLPPTWTGEPAGAYRGDRDSFLILVNGGSIVDDPSIASQSRSGEQAMYRGILIHNSEVGASSVTIEEILYRYICGNHMLWGAVIDRQYRRRHVGTRVLRDTVREISNLAFRWSNQSAARDTAIIRELIDREIAATKDAVIDELRAMGATREQAIAMYDTCERTEGASPRSFWGLAQGATRISQDTPYQDERYALDKLAAAVLTRGARLVRV